MEITLVGFPRSGNTFLRYSLFNMYPNHYFNRPVHTVRFLEENIEKDKIIMPIRNPADCIASWIDFKAMLINDQAYENKKTPYDITKVENAIKYYIRYFNHVLSVSDKILFLDFNLFKDNLEYVDINIKNRFNIKSECIPYVQDIKNILIEKEAYTQIPREKNERLDMIRLDVIKHEMLQDANNLYNKLKTIMESNNV